ncbi:hypothetical protein V7O67_04655 [Methanolobus sp. ZRKC4]|uniref:hypothetical protein n=1 Tax=Methanolobus sp. ZRKC4 TaxID=3125787 RepID=UPI003249007B
MESMRYMSLVFRGLVEEYSNSGVRPSVFMDARGDLQVYLCDSINDEMEEDFGIDTESEYDVNGGQFAQAYIMNKAFLNETVKYNLESEASLSQ